MRILAVTNDPHLQETLVQMQLRAPRDVIMMATSPQAALEAVETSRTANFDCIVIKDNMAKSDQSTLIPDLRNQQHGQFQPILVLADPLTNPDDIAGQDPSEATAIIEFPLPLAALQDHIDAACTPVEVPRPIQTGTATLNAPIALGAALDIYDIPGIVSLPTLDAYIGQLPRKQTYNGACFGLAIRDIELHHSALSPFDFHSLISDVADAIAEDMQNKTALFAYTGDGVFVGFASDTPAAQTQRIMRHVNTRLRAAQLRDSEGEAIDISLSAGDAVTFAWRSAKSAKSVLSEARANAILARNEQGKLRDQFWFMDRTA